ncbi:pH-response regulator protein RIM20 [Yarrowia lipolytica CLIB122] [Rhizoctonia solani]|uniref:pH-response regulator protein RIM20 [Yarrowia lipolytica CLIB122] n=1 Tax=Rhizoctonia solani TaxID=456999 RepID=A0A0K6GC39_9AGAM|nr:pH-response regulator protein RIM20 [Yarrowia lipolytica CLIB122] [Rhizoctonia solani]
MKVEQGFQQQPPPSLHPFLDDPVYPTSHAIIVQELVRFGDDINGYIRDLGKYVEPPTLVQYDQFGQRIDQLKTSEGWRRLKQVAAKEGMVSIAYDRATCGPLARVLMFIKTCLWTGDSHVVGCPVAMTDGAARVLELLGTPHMNERLLPRLTSRDPHLAYTTGQWMTERPGGSDVSHTETTAHPVYPNCDTIQNGAPYRLDGVKWFSSAMDGQLALALAQVPNQGLGLFIVPMPDADVQLFSPNANSLPFQPRNRISIHRLKNKIGTHALPTAELTLQDTIGFLLVPPQQGTIKPNGVRAISPVLNITRVHSAAGSIGNLTKCLSIARAYTHVRRVADPTRPGAQVLLADTPLHTATLAQIEVLRRALTHFLFGVVRLLGSVETETATESEQKRLRLLTPVLKAFAADRAVDGMEECMAALGGLGYMEGTGIGRLIRDSLVEKIWEGTINVLALDMLRAARGGAIAAFCEWSRDIIARSESGSDVVKLVKALTLLESLNFAHSHARASLVLVAYIASASYLLEHAQWSRLELDYVIVRLWIEEGGLNEAVKLVSAGPHEEWDKRIVYAKM